MQMAIWHVSKWQKEEQPCLVGGEERLGAFQVLQGRSFMVVGGGGIDEGGRKKGGKWGQQRRRKIWKKIVFLPTLHTDFFLFRKWNPLLFIRYGIRACYLY